ncbi:MAG TPA: hypothetical protein PKE31_17375 [Pseudomonadota bacterium]|nr:hypothetical protein [Pseudomonadota bacterium]
MTCLNLYSVTRNSLWLALCACLWWPLLDAQSAFGKSCPNLVILIDQSASMAQNPLGISEPPLSPNSKWKIATNALTAMNNRYDGLVPLGYTSFPTGVNCPVSPTVMIPPGYNNQVAINNAMIAYPIAGGSTPTCTAVTATATDLIAKDKTRTNYILLVTDGAPDALCCGADPVKTTVDAIRAAANPTLPGVPKVYTLVVGFGKTLDAERQALNQMADAGGFPVQGDPNYRYYRAEDATALEAALATIVKSVSSGDAGAEQTCEDGCYGKPCPSGQVCYQNECRVNPCETKTCLATQYCLPTFNSDGTNSAACVDSCSQPCPVTSRCDRGKCVGDPCSGKCQAGQRCEPYPDGSGGACIVEPLCATTICHNTQGCFSDGKASKCEDNFCNYITCPQGTVCRPVKGNCESPDPQPVQSLGSGGIGCSVGDGNQPGTAAWRLSLLVGGVFLAIQLHRRRRNRTSTHS